MQNIARHPHYITGSFMEQHDPSVQFCTGKQQYTLGSLKRAVTERSMLNSEN